MVRCHAWPELVLLMLRSLDVVSCIKKANYGQKEFQEEKMKISIRRQLRRMHVVGGRNLIYFALHGQAKITRYAS